MTRLKKLWIVLERNILRLISYVNRDAYKELYPKYLRKIGIRIPENYRDGGMGFIDPTAHFDGNDYSLISIGKNTTISTNVYVLTHDYSIAVGLKSIGIHEPKARFLKPVEIGNGCFIGARVLLLPGSKVGNNCIVGSGAVVSGCIPDNSICGGVPCKVICKTSEWAIKHIEVGDIVDVDIDRIRKECEEKNDRFNHNNPNKK